MGVPSMLPTIKSLGLSMPFLKVFGVKPLFQKGLAGVRGRAPRSPVPDKPQFTKKGDPLTGHPYVIQYSRSRPPTSW